MALYTLYPSKNKTHSPFKLSYLILLRHLGRKAIHNLFLKDISSKVVKNHAEHGSHRAQWLGWRVEVAGRSRAVGGLRPADPAGAGRRKGRPQSSASARIPGLALLPCLSTGRDEEARGREGEEE